MEEPQLVAVLQRRHFCDCLQTFSLIKSAPSTLPSSLPTACYSSPWLMDQYTEQMLFLVGVLRLRNAVYLEDLRKYRDF